MAQIGNVPEIVEIKSKLKQMEQGGLILEWELPYEQLLTRRSAAIIFLTPYSADKLPDIWEQLKHYENFRQRKNTEKSLSQLEYRVEFNKSSITAESF